MLILVGVTINLATNGGLFEKSRTASKDTEQKKILEELIAMAEFDNDGKIDVNSLTEKVEAKYDGSTYDQTNSKLTVKGNKGEFYYKVTDTEIKIWEDEKKESRPSTYEETIEGLQEPVTVVKYDDLEKETNADIKTAVDAGKIKTVLKEENYIAPVPTGFEVSTVTGENTISGGLVIKDGANEFVWIPCAEENYTEDSFGPLTETDSKSNEAYDSQKQLDYYYGENYYNYDQDFNYAKDKISIETSINKYKGFYVGRYETTINNGTIGCQRGAAVLTADYKLKEGTNSKNNQPYYYGWYGLYKVQKDLYATKDSVFSSMITSKEWDTIMTFTQYGKATRGETTYTTTPDLSGSVYKETTGICDLAKNIYDLAGNTFEWTLKTYSAGEREIRGGDCYETDPSASFMGGNPPTDNDDDFRISSCTVYKIAINI